MSNITIKDVKVFVTAPKDINLVVVKVETSEPGLVGYGCATFTWRHTAVVKAVEDYLVPAVKGRCVDDIEDIWQVMKGSSYWRNGPVLNNAISGIDEALWDIKGKMANMPLYSLIGGRSRTGILVYRHADGNSIDAVEKQVQSYLDEGYKYIRCQMGTYGGNYDGTRQSIDKPKDSFCGSYYNPDMYIRSVLEHISFPQSHQRSSHKHLPHPTLQRAQRVKRTYLGKDCHKAFLQQVLRLNPVSGIPHTYRKHTGGIPLV